MSQNSEKRLRKSCYSGIDELPILNWFSIFKNNDYAQLFRVRRDIKKGDMKVVGKIFTEFYDDYLKNFGLNETMEKIVDLKKSLIQNMNKYIQGDGSALTWIEIEEDQLKELQGDGESQTIWELKGRVEVALKINIDVKKCTVMEFYSYLKIISEMNNKAA